MGQKWSRTQAASGPVLTPDEVAELSMVSGYTDIELAKLYKRFLASVPDGGNHPLMTRDAFLALPEVCDNPLRERLADVFGFKSLKGITFKDFCTSLSVLSPLGAKDAKVKVAFDMYDFDGDGKISHKDLLQMLQLTVDTAELVGRERTKMLAQVVTRVMAEASTHPHKHYLTKDDFSTVCMSIDGFEQKMNIPLR